MKKKEVTLCYCGIPLHYTDPFIENQVKQLVSKYGEMVIVTNHLGENFNVPRHYVALHGLREENLSKLGFKRTEEKVG